MIGLGYFLKTRMKERKKYKIIHKWSLGKKTAQTAEER